MSNSIAPEGQVYVCKACGKQSKDKYGNYPISKGWDVSCMMHSILAYESTITLGGDGRVIGAEAVPLTDYTEQLMDAEDIKGEMPKLDDDMEWENYTPEEQAEAIQRHGEIND